MKTINLEIIAYREENGELKFVESEIQKKIFELLKNKENDVDFKVINKSVELKFDERELNRYSKVAKLMYEDLLDIHSGTYKFLRFFLSFNGDTEDELLRIKAETFEKYMLQKFIISDKELTGWLNNRNSKRKFLAYSTIGSKPKNYNFYVKYYIPEDAIYVNNITTTLVENSIFDCKTDDALDYFLPRFYQTMLNIEEDLVKRPDIKLDLKKNWPTYVQVSRLD